MKVLYNNEFVRKDADGRSYITTRMKYPNYVNADDLLEGIDNITIGSKDIEINKIGDFSVNLQRSKWFPEIEPTLDVNVILRQVKQMIPESDEVLPWMQESTAYNVFLQQREAEYNRYSQLISNAGDGNCPGVIVDRIGFRGEIGADVYYNGAYGFIINQHFHQNNVSDMFHVLKDVLALTSVHSPGPGAFQWQAIVVKWRAIANTPVSNVGFVGFFNKYGNFFGQVLKQKSERAIARQIYAVTKAQEVTITFRDPNDYTRVLDRANISFDNSGNYEIRYEIASYPYVPPVLVQIESSEYCALRQFTFQQG